MHVVLKARASHCRKRQLRVDRVAILGARGRTAAFEAAIGERLNRLNLIGSVSRTKVADFRKLLAMVLL